MILFTDILHCRFLRRPLPILLQHADCIYNKIKVISQQGIEKPLPSQWHTNSAASSRKSHDVLDWGYTFILHWITDQTFTCWCLFFNLFTPPELMGLSLVSPDILQVRKTQAQALTNVVLLPSVVSYYLDSYSLKFVLFNLQKKLL